MTVKLPGFHQWKDAPEEVEFLRHPHRHLFVFKVEFTVRHHDRELEFFIVRRRVETTAIALGEMGVDGVNFGGQSCEMLALGVLRRLNADVVEVWEDGENGARVERCNCGY